MQSSEARRGERPPSVLNLQNARLQLAEILGERILLVRPIASARTELTMPWTRPVQPWKVLCLAAVWPAGCQTPEKNAVRRDEDVGARIRVRDLDPRESLENLCAGSAVLAESA